jgi:PDDEXK-like domain of unknown function (DUF3799)
MKPMKIREWDGEPISEPGWVSGIPIERYHSAGMCVGPSVSSSNLRKCWSHSPAHCFAQWAENPNREERPMTSAMLLGGCAHYILLGEDNFKLKYISQPPLYPDRKTGEMKAWSNNSIFAKEWHAKAALEGKVVVTEKVLNNIVEMARTLAREPLVNDGILSGYVETSGFFLDKETNLWIKTRPDVIPHTDTDSDFVDLKTTSEVITPALMSSIRTYGYHQQAALCWEACETFGHPFTSFMLVFCETTNPWCVRTVPLPEQDISLGRQQNRSSLRKIRAGIDSGVWPGPGEGELVDFGLSKDERERVITRLKMEGLA